MVDSSRQIVPCGHDWFFMDFFAYKVGDMSLKKFVLTEVVLVLGALKDRESPVWMMALNGACLADTSSFM